MCQGTDSRQLYGKYAMMATLGKFLRKRPGLAAAFLCGAFVAGVTLLQLAYFPPGNPGGDALRWTSARIVGYALFWPSSFALAALTSFELTMLIRGVPVAVSEPRLKFRWAGSWTALAIGLAVIVLFTLTFSAAISGFCERL